MIPRGRLDISAGELGWAAVACFRPHCPGALARCVQTHWPAWHVLPALSVRTAWDAWLAEQHWLPGDEILVSAVTIPDMLRIIRQHGLTPVPVPVDFESLAVAPEDIEQRITPRTRALLVAHLFGSRMNVGSLKEVTARRGLLLVEDAAQAFTGTEAFATPASDVVLLSFGPIKTCTALGGGLILLRDPEVAERLAQRLAGYPPQSTREFLSRVLKMAAVQCLAWPPAFTALLAGLRVCGIDPDPALSSLLRGFTGRNFWKRLRRRPAPALLALLERRLRMFDTRQLTTRVQRARCLWNLLGNVERPGTSASEHTQWVLPIVVTRPDQFVGQLRSCGYDATQLASSVTQFAGHSTGEDQRWNQLVYLPHHPQMRPDRLAAILSSLLPATPAADPNACQLRSDDPAGILTAGRS